MSRKALIVAALAWVLTVVIAFALGHQMGKAGLLIAPAEARQGGEDFQRAWYEGLDKAQAERAEKNRVMQEQEDANRAASDARTRQQIIDFHANYDCNTDPHCHEAMTQLPEDQRAAFAQKMNDWNRQRAKEIAAGAPLY